MRRTLAMVVRHNRRRTERYSRCATTPPLTADVVLLSRVTEAVSTDGTNAWLARELAYSALRALGSEEAVKVVAVAMAEHCRPGVDVEAHGDGGEEPLWYAYVAQSRLALRVVLPQLQE